MSLNNPLNKLRPRAGSRGERQTPAALLVVQAAGESLRGVVTQRGRGGMRLEHVQLGGEDAAAGSLPPGLKNKPQVVVLLPKSMYLTKRLMLPAASAEETDQMLRLELEAQLPPGFGESEIGYRPVTGGPEGRNRQIEAYAAGREELTQILDRLRLMGLEPARVAPSAAVWRQVWAQATESGVDLMAARVWAGEYEAAWLDGAKAVRVRTIYADDDGDLEQGLAECLRSIELRDPLREKPVVGWFGGDRPAADLIDVINAGGLIGSPTEPEPDAVDATEWALLTLGARVLAEHGEKALPASADLLPASLRQANRTRTALRAIGVAAASFLMALVVLGAALEIASARYQNVNQRLADRLAAIRADGEAVGLRLEQLRTVQSARASRDCFQQLLTGLLRATPQGVSYNRVTLNDEGRLQLHGQAQSLASPFLLPQRLEELPAFESVTLQDAGQSKRGEGTVVEFRAEARFIARGEE